MNTEQGKVWFPAKRYGWGWGVPVTWQGWLVLLAYLAVIGGTLHFLPPSRNQWAFAAVAFLATAALLGICWVKGESPRWRWRWGGR